MKNSPIKTYTKNLIKEANQVNLEKVSLKDIKWPVNEPWNINNSRYQKLYISWMDKVEFLHILNNKNISKIKIQNLKVNQLTRMQNVHNDMAYAVNKIAKSLKLADSFLIAYVDYVNSVFSVGNEMIATTETYVNRRISFEDIQGPVHEPAKILCNKYQKVYIDWLELINQIKKINNFNITMIRQGKWDIMKIRRESALYNQKVDKVNQIAKYLQLAENFVVAKVDYLNPDYIKKAQIDKTIISSKDEIRFREIVGPIYDPSRVNNSKYQRLYSYWLEEINNLKIIHNRNIDLISDGMISERKIEKLQNEYNYLVRDVNDLFEDLKLAERYRVARVNYFINVYEKKYYQEDAGEITYNEMRIEESGVPFLTIDKPLELDLSEKTHVERMEAEEIKYKKVVKDIQDTQKVLDDFVNFEEVNEELIIPEQTKEEFILTEKVVEEDDTDYTITDENFDITLQSITEAVDEEELKDREDVTATFIKEHALFDWNGRPVYNEQKQQLIANPEILKLDITNVYDENFRPLFSNDKELPYGYSLFDWLGDQVYDELGNFIVEEVKINFDAKKPKYKKDDTQFIKFIPQPKDPKGTKLYDWHGNPVFDKQGKQLETDGENAQILDTEIFDVNGNKFTLEKNKLPYTKALFNKNGFKSLDVLQDSDAKESKGVPAKEYYAKINKPLPLNSTELEKIEENKEVNLPDNDEQLIVVKKPSSNNVALLFDRNKKLVFSPNKEPLELNSDLGAVDYSIILNSAGKPLASSTKSPIVLFDSQGNVVFDKDGFLVEQELTVPRELKNKISFKTKPVKEKSTLLFDINSKPVFDKNKKQLTVESVKDKVDFKNVFDNKGKSVLKNKENQIYGLALFAADKEQVYTKDGQLIYKEFVEVNNFEKPLENLVENDISKKDDDFILIFDKNNEPLFDASGNQLNTGMDFSEFYPSKIFTKHKEPAFHDKKNIDLYDASGNPLNEVKEKIGEQPLTCSLPPDYQEKLNSDRQEQYPSVGTLMFDKKGNPLFFENKEHAFIDEENFDIKEKVILNEKGQPLFNTKKLDKVDFAVFDSAKNEIINKDGKLNKIKNKSLEESSQIFDIDGNQLFNKDKQPLHVDNSNLKEILSGQLYDKKGKPYKLKENQRAIFDIDGNQLTNKQGAPLIEKSLDSKIASDDKILVKFEEPIAPAGTQLFSKKGEQLFNSEGQLFVTDGKLNPISDKLFNEHGDLVIDPTNKLQDATLFDKNNNKVYNENGDLITEDKFLEVSSDNLAKKVLDNGDTVDVIKRPIVKMNENLFLTDGTELFDENQNPITLNSVNQKAPERIFSKNGSEIKYPDNNKTIIDSNGLVAFDKKGNLKFNEIPFEKVESNKNDVAFDIEKTNENLFEEKPNQTVENQKLFLLDGTELFDENQNPITLNSVNQKAPERIFSKNGSEIKYPDNNKTLVDDSGIVAFDKKGNLKLSQNYFDETYGLKDNKNSKQDGNESGEIKNQEQLEVVEKLIKKPMAQEGEQLFNKKGKPVYNKDGEKITFDAINEKFDGEIFDKNGKSISDKKDSQSDKTLYNKKGTKVFDENGDAIFNTEVISINPDKIKIKELEDGNTIEILSEPLIKNEELLFTQNGEPVFDEYHQQLRTSQDENDQSPETVFDKKGRDISHKLDNIRVLFDKNGNPAYDRSGDRLKDEKILNDLAENKTKSDNLSQNIKPQKETEEVLVTIQEPLAPKNTPLFTKDKKPLFNREGEQILTDGRMEKFSQPVYSENGEIVFDAAEENIDKTLYDEFGKEIFDKNGSPILLSKNINVKPEEVKTKKTSDGSEVKYIQKPLVKNDEQLYLTNKEPVYKSDGTPLLFKDDLSSAPEELYSQDGKLLNNLIDSKTLVNKDGIIAFNRNGDLNIIETPVVALEKSISNENVSTDLELKESDYKNSYSQDSYDNNPNQDITEGQQIFLANNQPVYNRNGDILKTTKDMEHFSDEMFDEKGNSIPEAPNQSLYISDGTKVLDRRENAKNISPEKSFVEKPSEDKNLEENVIAEIKVTSVSPGAQLYTKDKRPVFNSKGKQLLNNGKLSKINETVFDEKGKIIFDPKDENSDKSLFDKDGNQAYKENGKPLLKNKEVKIKSGDIKKTVLPSGEKIKFIEKPVVDFNEPLYLDDNTPVFKFDGSPLIFNDVLSESPENFYSSNGIKIKNDDETKSLFDKNGLEVFDKNGKLKTVKEPIVKILDSEHENNKFENKELENNEIENNELENNELENNELEDEQEEKNEREIESVKVEKIINSPVAPIGTLLFSKDNTPIYELSGKRLKLSENKNPWEEGIYNSNLQPILELDNKNLYDAEGNEIFNSDGNLILKHKKVLVDKKDIETKVLPNGEKVETIKSANVDKGQFLFLKDNTQVYDKNGSPILSTGTDEPLRGDVFDRSGKNLFKDPKYYENGKSLFTKEGVPVYDMSGSAVTNESQIIDEADINNNLEAKTAKIPDLKSEKVKAKIKTPIAKVGTPLFTKDQEPVFTSEGQPLKSDGQVSRITSPVFDKSGNLLFALDDQEKDKSLFDKEGRKLYSETGKPVLETVELEINPEEVKTKKLPSGDTVNYIEKPLVETGQQLFLKDGTPVYKADKTPLTMEDFMTKTPEKIFDIQSREIDQKDNKALFDKNQQMGFDDKGNRKTIKSPIVKLLDETKRETDTPKAKNDSKEDKNILKTHENEEIILLEPTVEEGTLLFDKKGRPVFDVNGNQLTQGKVNEVVAKEIFDVNGEILNKDAQEKNIKPYLFDESGKKATEIDGTPIVKEVLIDLSNPIQKDKEIEIIIVPIAKIGTKLYTENGSPVFYSSGQPVVVNYEIEKYDFSDIYDNDGELVAEQNENQELFDFEGTHVIEDGELIKVKRAVKKNKEIKKDDKANRKAKVKENIDKFKNSQKHAKKDLDNVFDEANSRLEKIKEELKEITDNTQAKRQPKSVFDKLTEEYEDDYDTEYDLLESRRKPNKSKSINDDLEPLPSMQQSFVPKENNFFNKIEDRMNSIEQMLAILTNQDKTMDSSKIRILKDDIDRIYADINNISSSVPSFTYNNQFNRKPHDFDICGCKNDCGSSKRRHHVYNSGNNFSQRGNDFKVANFSHHHNCHHKKNDGHQICEHCGNNFNY
ncbi:hypothetical protein [Spiroplasma endosymbiont of Panorpa germanica]|uniref:hypothetical protein n=1 Tax=Spiroplasma endosymbiont of Panorpa germanica TaxID=3066314 RepID=UPI0030D2E699